MKAVSDYMIGNVAVKIVDTGRSIRIIDIEKALEKKVFRKKALAIILMVGLTLMTSLSVVNRQSEQTSLKKQVYALKSEIQTLELENETLEKTIKEKENFSYKQIFKKARSLGMDFPRKGQIKLYHSKGGKATDKATGALMFDQTFFVAD